MGTTRVCTETGTTRVRAERFMQREVAEFVDECGEVDCTGLAETTADELNIYVDRVDYEIPEWVFELAFDVAQEFES